MWLRRRNSLQTCRNAIDDLETDTSHQVVLHVLTHTGVVDGDGNPKPFQKALFANTKKFKKFRMTSLIAWIVCIFPSIITSIPEAITTEESSWKKMRRTVASVRMRTLGRLLAGKP